MKVELNLTIKRRWFDMIASGEKREEYRNFDNVHARLAFAQRSLCEPADVTMILRNGYRMDSPSLAVHVKGIQLRHEAVHPEWGEPKHPHYAIILDKILARGTYAGVKGKMVG